MYNKVIMVGNLCKDPELRYTPAGKAVCDLRVAVSNKYKSGDEWKEDILFIDVTVWGNSGEACSQYLTKGSKVLVDGRLQEQKWESDGQKRNKTIIVASSVQFLDSKGDSNQGSQSDNSQGGGNRPTF